MRKILACCFALALGFAATGHASAYPAEIEWNAGVDSRGVYLQTHITTLTTYADNWMRVWARCTNGGTVFTRWVKTPEVAIVRAACPSPYTETGEWGTVVYYP